MLSGCTEGGAVHPAFKGGPQTQYADAMDILLCLTTCPDETTATTIATTLVEEGLAACVNLLPGLQSVYRWQGKLDSASEVLLLVKTTANRYPQLEARLQALHPYELPELVAVKAHGGLPAYLHWVAEATRPIE